MQKFPKLFSKKLLKYLEVSETCLIFVIEMITKAVAKVVNKTRNNKNNFNFLEYGTKKDSL